MDAVIDGGGRDDDIELPACWSCTVESPDGWAGKVLFEDWIVNPLTVACNISMSA